MGEKDMGKKKQKVLYDADGARRVMRKRDYMADMGGQLALGVMANLVGQLTYFYTDKVGMAVGGVGIAMMIAKIIDHDLHIWAYLRIIVNELLQAEDQIRFLQQSSSL